MSSQITSRIYEIVEGTTNDKISKAFQYFIMILISLNVILVILESESSISDTYGQMFRNIEIISLVIFIIEYVVRIIVCKKNPQYANSKYGFVRFAMTPLMLIDLATILPFFLSSVLPITDDLRIIRIIRLLRIFKVFKLTRYAESMNLLAKTLRNKISDLIIAFFIFFIVLIFASSLMYSVEHEAQPIVFSSIPSSMWWGVITLTTIGYGDVYPVTPVGKMIGVGVAILGIAVYAIPTGIIASAFIEALRSNTSAQKKESKCPHCGKLLK